MRRLATFTVTALIAACSAPLYAQSGMEPSKSEKTEKKETASLKVGDAAPTLTIEKWVKGSPVNSFDSGKTYVVEFWATWCGPCIKSMPHLSKLQKEFKDKGLTIIGVTSVDKSNTLGKVEEMVSEKAETMGYTVAWDKDRTTNKAYMDAANQNGIPCSFVVDGKGKIAFIGHPQALEFVLNRVMAGKWDYVDGPKSLKAAAMERREIMEKADEDPKGALKDMDAYAVKYPEFAAMLDDARYQMMIEAGDAASAAQIGGRLVDKMVAEKDAQGLNEIAWGIVDPESTFKVKDYTLAMKAATKANEISGDKNAAILDTLARCYFVKGDRQKAIELQKKAVASLSDDEKEMKGELEATLREYEKGSN